MSGREIKGTLEDWNLMHGCIHGTLNGKSIRTSRITSREDDIITTVSGSAYKLGSLGFHMKEPEFLDYFVASTALEAVDYVIKENHEFGYC